MDRNADALADQLLALPSVDRARLAELLLASIEEHDAGAASVWDNEIDRRANELENRLVDGISAAEVFAEVEQQLHR